MHDSISAKGKRLLKVWRGKSVVDKEQSTCVVSNSRKRRDIRNVEQRVGWSLEPDNLCLSGTYGSSYRVDVREVCRRVLQPPAVEHSSKEAVRAAVGVVRNHHVVAGLAHRTQECVLSREA